MTISIALVGLNFRTAAIEIREQLALTGLCAGRGAGAPCRAAVRCKDRRGGRPDAPEAVILSTCNRLEFYLVAMDEEAAVEAVIDYLGNAHGISGERIRGHLYVKLGSDAVEHLLRVDQRAGVDGPGRAADPRPGWAGLRARSCRGNVRAGPLALVRALRSARASALIARRASASRRYRSATPRQTCSPSNCRRSAAAGC